MLLLDVNVLVYAHREDVPEHERYRRWLEDVINGDEAYGISTLVLSGFLRVVTHPKVFGKPTPLAAGVAFTEELRSTPSYVEISPGPRHWHIFVELCQRSTAKGNHVPDAFHAALAIESGCEWITTDSGFGRFSGLRWRHPFD